MSVKYIICAVRENAKLKYTKCSVAIGILYKAKTCNIFFCSLREANHTIVTKITLEKS